MGPPIVRQRISTQVFRRLRSKILRGRLSHGTRLLEVDIAEDLGVSRTPVREALVLLQGQGLVRPTGSGGYEVCDIEQELTEVLEIRAVLEGHAVRNAAAVITDAQLAALDTLCTKMEKLPFEDWRREAALNREFHMSLAAAAQNERLLRIIGDYHSFFEYQGFVAKRLLDRDFMDRTMQDHRMIVDALRRRCGEEAAQLISEHIAGARHLIKLLREGLVSMDEDGEPAAKDFESELDGVWLRDPTYIVA